MKIRINDIPQDDAFAFKIPTPATPEDVRKELVGHEFTVWEAKEGSDNAIKCCTHYDTEDVRSKAYTLSMSEIGKILGKNSPTVKWYAGNRPAINTVVFIDKKACSIVT